VIGATLPEFEVLNYPAKAMAYFIRCPQCVSIFRDPRDEEEKSWVQGWNDELEKAKKELEGEASITAAPAVKVKVEESDIKMEDSDSASPSSFTTIPEEMSIDTTKRSFGFLDVEDLRVGAREVIVID
jgi:hypothetical protein